MALHPCGETVNTTSLSLVSCRFDSCQGYKIKVDTLVPSVSVKEIPVNGTHDGDLAKKVGERYCNNDFNFNWSYSLIGKTYRYER